MRAKMLLAAGGLCVLVLAHGCDRLRPGRVAGEKAQEEAGDVAGTGTIEPGIGSDFKLVADDERIGSLGVGESLPEAFRVAGLRVAFRGYYLPIEPNVRYAYPPFRLTGIRREEE